MLKKMKALFVEEEGQGMTEYGLVLGVIAVAVIVAFAALKVHKFLQCLIMFVSADIQVA